MRLDEINERLSAIKVELDGENVNVDVLETETNGLLEERKAIIENAEKRQKLVESVVNLPESAVIRKFEDKPEGKKVENVMETRAKQLLETGKMVIDGAEARSIILSTGTLAKPTEVGGINPANNIISSIIDLVAVESLQGVGSYQEAYQLSHQTADVGTDGSAPTPSDPAFRTVNINPFLIDTLTYVSRNIKRQSPLDYEEKVRNGSMIALRRKAVEYIIKGNGSTQPFGIYNAVNTESSPGSMTKELAMTAATIDATTLRKIVFAYGGDENIGTGAKLFLNKLDLIAFGDVRGTNEKKAVYEIEPNGANPNIGIIKDGGLAVQYVICSDVTALSAQTKGVAKIPTMIYGDPAAYKLALFGDYEVRVSEDYKFAEGLLSVKGEAMIGGNVRFDKGFVVATLAVAN